MTAFFVLIFLASGLALVVGLIRPALVLPWRRGRATRAAVVATYIATALISFVLIGITAPPVDDVASEQAVDVIAPAPGDSESDSIRHPARPDADRGRSPTDLEHDAGPTAVAEAPEGIGPGTHLVGSDIEAGRYRSEGTVNYFARLAGLGGSMGDIIANDAAVRGPVVVDILPTDTAFQTKGSGRWVRVDATYAPSTRASFSDGTWIVGVDIEPGVYRSEGRVSYWARLSGFSHEMQDIVANDAMVDGAAIVEIDSDDVGFTSKGGATWKKIR